MRAGALVLVLVAGCGRIGFDPGGGDAATMSDGGAGSGIRHVRVFAQRDPGAGTSDSFPAQIDANDLVLMLVGCRTAGAPTSLTASAPTWTFTPVGSLFGDGATSMYAQVFAITSAVSSSMTVSVQATGATCLDLVVLADEFGIASGSLVVDAVAESGLSGPACQQNVTTGAANEAVWAACHATADITNVGPGFTKAVDDQFGDWSEYKLGGDPANTMENAGFVAPNGGFTIAMITVMAQ